MGTTEVTRGRETDTDLPGSVVGTVRRRGSARTSPPSRGIRGKTPGSCGRSSPGANLRVILVLAAPPGLATETWPPRRAARLDVLAAVVSQYGPSNGKGTTSGRYDAVVPG